MNNTCVHVVQYTSYLTNTRLAFLSPSTTVFRKFYYYDSVSSVIERWISSFHILAKSLMVWPAPRFRKSKGTILWTFDGAFRVAAACIDESTVFNKGKGMLSE